MQILDWTLEWTFPEWTLKILEKDAFSEAYFEPFHAPNPIRDVLAG